MTLEKKLNEELHALIKYEFTQKTSAKKPTSTHQTAEVVEEKALPTVKHGIIKNRKKQNTHHHKKKKMKKNPAGRQVKKGKEHA